MMRPCLSLLQYPEYMTCYHQIGMIKTNLCNAYRLFVVHHKNVELKSSIVQLKKIFKSCNVQFFVTFEQNKQNYSVLVPDVLNLDFHRFSCKYIIKLIFLNWFYLGICLIRTYLNFHWPTICARALVSHYRSM